MARKMSWREFGNVAYAMKQLMGLSGAREEDELGRMKDVASLQESALDIAKKRRELQGPSEGEKWKEEQRKEQVKSAIGMFSELYKTASPANKKVLGEKMGSLWGMMGPGERAEVEMIVSHTPINPRVQKAMWFEESNPAPRMPIVREGDGTWTNQPPRTPEYRRVWAEFDIAMDEWNTLRQMAVEGKKPGDKGMEWKKVPKMYQTDDPQVSAYRDPIDRKIKYFRFDQKQADVANAIENGWQTPQDIMEDGFTVVSSPKDFVLNRTPVTVRQVKDNLTRQTKLQYSAAGPMEEIEGKPPKELVDTIYLLQSGLKPGKLKIKDPRVVGFYSQLTDIVKSKGEERVAKQLTMQRQIVEAYPEDERFVPFVPSDVATGFWYKLQNFGSKFPLIGLVIPDPSIATKDSVVLARVDREVQFFDKKGERMMFWWNDAEGIALDDNGMPILELQGKTPGDQIDMTWSELEKRRR